MVACAFFLVLASIIAFHAPSKEGGQLYLWSSGFLGNSHNTHLVVSLLQAPHEFHAVPMQPGACARGAEPQYSSALSEEWGGESVCCLESKTHSHLNTVGRDWRNSSRRPSDSGYKDYPTVANGVNG